MKASGKRIENIIQSLFERRNPSPPKEVANALKKYFSSEGMRDYSWTHDLPRDRSAEDLLGNFVSRIRVRWQNKESGVIHVDIPYELDRNISSKNLIEAIIGFGSHTNRIRPDLDLGKVQKIVRHTGWTAENQDIADFTLKFTFPNYVDKRDLPRFLYHVTDGENEDHIMRYGLKPKDTSDVYQYSHRVHFFTRYDEFSMKHLARARSVSKGMDSNEIVIIEYDRDVFDRANFFLDTNFSGYKYDAIWTPTHIPASALEVYDYLSLLER